VPVIAPLTQLEQSGRIGLIVTQNVDGLHQKAGSRAVLELHGGLARVVCLDCRQIHARTEVQDWIAAANPGIAATSATAGSRRRCPICPMMCRTLRCRPARPAAACSSPTWCFSATACRASGVRAVTEAIDGAAGLLVVGSSLMVYSGFRFAEHAHRTGKPVIAVNLGRTRADHLLAAKVEQDCDAFLDGLILSA
jgi:NAD-dependent SIR2 family protein deacetylase